MIENCSSKQPKYTSLNGEATECSLYKHCGYLLQTASDYIHHVKLDPLTDQKQEITFLLFLMPS